MRKISSMRGISSGPSRSFRSSGSRFRSSSSNEFKYNPYRSGLNNHHSHLYRRPYGNSMIPLWARITFLLLLLGFLAIFG